jgi:hypothetical protein
MNYSNLSTNFKEFETFSLGGIYELFYIHEGDGRGSDYGYKYESGSGRGYGEYLGGDWGEGFWDDYEYAKVRGNGWISHNKFR